jgi:prephenate dehydratase
MILAYSGIKGSFSEEAAIAYDPNAELLPALDMDGTLEAVNQGTADLGIFPVTNSTGGLVETAYEAMGRHDFQLVDKLPFEVNQCLLALPNTKPEDIKKIASHPQALTQCKNYLSKTFPNAELVEWSDTATAARDLKEKSIAVLAPAQSAKEYGLEILAEKVQDEHPNITTFIIIKPTTS